MLRGSGVDAMLSLSVSCSSIHTSWRRQRQPATALPLIFHCRFFYLYHFIPYAFFVRMNGIYWMFPFVAHWCLLQVWGWGVGGGWVRCCYRCVCGVGGVPAAGVGVGGGVLL